MGLWSEGMNPGTLAANSVSLANNFLSKPYRFKAKWNTEKNRINPYGYKAREEFRYVRTKRSKHGNTGKCQRWYKTKIMGRE